MSGKDADIIVFSVVNSTFLSLEMANSENSNGTGDLGYEILFEDDTNSDTIITGYPEENDFASLSENNDEFDGECDLPMCSPCVQPANFFSDNESLITIDSDIRNNFLNEPASLDDSLIGQVLSQETIRLTPKRHRYKLSTKIQVLKMMDDTGLPVKDVSEALRINRRNLERWRNQQEKLNEVKESKKEEIRKRCNITRDRRQLGKFPEPEREVYNRLKDRRERGLIVNGKWIIQTAKEAANRGIGETDFKASNGWIYRFLKRFDVSLRAPTSVGQKDPADARQQALDFFEYFSRLRQRLNGYHITYANLDEVPVWFDMPGGRTYDVEGNRTIKALTTGNEKLRFTVVLCTLSTGEKVKPMIVFRTPKKIDINNENIYVTGSKGGSMTTELMELWRKKCWKVRPNYSIDNIPGERSKRKTVLILDSARCHLDSDLHERMNRLNNTEVKIITGGMTKYLQPADIVYNKPFKNHIKDSWNDWMENGLIEMTRFGRRRPASRETVTDWIKNAFGKIPAEMIKSSYDRCGIIDEEASDRYHHRLLQLITQYENDTEGLDDHTGITDDELENDI